jgi:hypothetical protein
MISGLDIFSKCVNAESGIGAAGDADFAPELLVPAKALDVDGAEIPDGPLVESTGFVDCEGATSAPEELKGTAEVLAELEKADCTGATADVEEGERVDTDELIEFGDVRLGEGAQGELPFCVDELWT